MLLCTVLIDIAMTQSEITFRISGKYGNEELTPSNFDIAQIRVLFDELEALLYPGKKQKDRPVITYEMRTGSVINVFKTSLQQVLAFSAILGVIEMDGGSIDRLENNSARAIENLQSFARRYDYDIEIGTSDNPARRLKVTPHTNYIRHENIMVDVEAYYYGTLIDAGGKDKANIHLDTKEAGVLIIKSDKGYLSDYKGNPLYRKFGVRVCAKQNIVTGDIDKSSFTLIELIDYQAQFDEDYLNSLISKTTPKWNGVDADTWLANLRGGIL